MANLIKLPRKFFEDHEDRALPTPEIVKENKRNIWIDRNDPNLEELKSDAEFYSDPWGPEVSVALRNSAKATLAAIIAEVAA